MEPKAINDNAPVVCRKSITIEAKPEKIWKILTDIDNWLVWNHGISFSKIHGPLEPNVAFTWKSGGMKIRSVLHTVSPYYNFGWSGKSLGIFAIHNWMLKATEIGTEVTTSESMEGLLVKFLKNKIRKTTDKSLEAWLEQLKTTCEEQSNNDFEEGSSTFAV